MEKNQHAESSINEDSLDVDDSIPELEQPQSDSSDEEFMPSTSSCTSNKTKSQDIRTTRSSSTSHYVNIMETLVVMESAFKVEERKCTQLLAFIANKIFGQNWSIDNKEDEEDMEIDEFECEDDELAEP